MPHFDGFEMDFQQDDWATYLSDDTLTAIVVNLRTGRKVKTFKGETAWSDSARFAADKAVAELYA